MVVQCTNVTLAHFVAMDKERNRCKRKTVKYTQERRRRLLNSQIMIAESSRRKCEKDVTTYQSGCFGSGLSSFCSSKELTPILVANNDDNEIYEKCGMHDCPTLRDQKNDDWAGCDFCESWFHAGCEDVRF